MRLIDSQDLDTKSCLQGNRRAWADTPKLSLSKARPTLHASPPQRHSPLVDRLRTRDPSLPSQERLRRFHPPELGEPVGAAKQAWKPKWDLRGHT